MLIGIGVLAGAISGGYWLLREQDQEPAPVPFKESEAIRNLDLGNAKLAAALRSPGEPVRFVFFFADKARQGGLFSMVLSRAAQPPNRAAFVFTLDDQETLEAAAKANPRAVILDQMDLRLSPKIFRQGSFAVELDKDNKPIRAFSLRTQLKELGQAAATPSEGRGY